MILIILILLAIAGFIVILLWLYSIGFEALDCAIDFIKEKLNHE